MSWAPSQMRSVLSKEVDTSRLDPADTAQHSTVVGYTDWMGSNHHQLRLVVGWLEAAGGRARGQSQGNEQAGMDSGRA